ncbi:hypothetical protein AAEX28_13680 [Lentisphaerota bacterium WC36G]|nr:hemerythrin domain-containing protein [Lentisphaerae bacterium WC36]
MTEITKNSTIGLVIAENVKTAPIFDNYGINIGRKNTKKIGEVCQKLDLNIENILADLHKVPPPLPGEQPDFLNMPLDELCKYIVVNHHQFLYRNVPKMEEYLIKASEYQGNEFPALHSALKSFKDFEEIMYRHLKMEEQEYFPFVKKMVKIANKETVYNQSFPHSTRSYVKILTNDHRKASKLVAKVCRFVKYKNPPKNASDNYLKFIQLVDKLHQDIFLHITLEDSILQPKSIDLEQQINALKVIN